MRNDYESNYLAHHGILGQKWGHKNGPPYPLDAKSHSQSEKKAGFMKSIKDKHEVKKKAKKQKVALEKARAAKVAKQKEAQKNKEYAERKEQILKSGSAKEVLRYKGQMSNNELSAALNRIQWEKQLSQIAAAEEKSNWDKMDDLMNKVGKVTGYVNKGIYAYNAIDKALGIIDPERKKKPNQIPQKKQKG